MKRDLNKILDRMDEYEKIQSEFITLLNEYLDEKELSDSEKPDTCDAITHLYCEDEKIHLQFEYYGHFEIPFGWIKDSEKYWESQKFRMKEYWKAYYKEEVEKLNSRLEFCKKKLKRLNNWEVTDVQ